MLYVSASLLAVVEDEVIASRKETTASELQLLDPCYLTPVFSSTRIPAVVCIKCPGVVQAPLFAAY